MEKGIGWKGSVFAALLMLAGMADAGAVAHFTINVGDDVDGNAAVCSLRAAFKNINTQSKDGIGGNNVNNPGCPKGELVNDIRLAIPRVTLKDQISHSYGVVTILNGEISGNHETRLFHVAGDATTLIFNRVSLIAGNGNGGSGGAILVEGQANLALRGTGLFSNRAQTDGGAIALMGSGQFSTFKAIFRNNSAGARGGAILVGGSTAADQTPPTLWASILQANTAGNSGGAVECTDSGVRLVVSLDKFIRNLVTSNDGSGEGGAISSYCDLTIKTSKFEENSVDQGSGGAVYSAGPTRVTDVYFFKNSAGLNENERGSGGGFFVDGPLSMRRSSFFQNYAFDRAGAMMVGNGAANHDVSIANTSFIENDALAGEELRPGGAIWVTGLSFPRKGFDPKLNYNAYRFEFFNNTVAGNFGQEQIYLDPGPGKEILFVNNLMQSAALPACGGDPGRLQLTRPIDGAFATNIQYPGKSCDTASETMASYKIAMGADQFGGLLAQHFQLPDFSNPATFGDKIICNGAVVASEDQLGNARDCRIGSVEKAQPAIYPPEY